MTGKKPKLNSKTVLFKEFNILIKSIEIFLNDENINHFGTIIGMLQGTKIEKTFKYPKSICRIYENINKNRENIFSRFRVLRFFVTVAVDKNLIEIEENSKEKLENEKTEHGRKRGKERKEGFEKRIEKIKKLKLNEINKINDKNKIEIFVFSIGTEFSSFPNSNFFFTIFFYFD